MEGSEKRDVTRFKHSSVEKYHDDIAVEKPLSISLRYRSEIHNLGVTMRTPVNDKEMIFGLFYSEGIIDDKSEIIDLSIRNNEAMVDLGDGANFNPQFHIRDSTVNSSCGICGRKTIADILQSMPKRGIKDFSIDPSIISICLKRLKEYQTLFEKTGGSHACASVNQDGIILNLFEDVGRHNAMDKLVGSMLLDGQINDRSNFSIVSGRASFELVYKAIRAGFPMMLSIGAPSTMAVDISREFGLALGCFVNSQSIIVYSGSKSFVFSNEHKE